jgi:hypothetical protein
MDASSILRELMRRDAVVWARRTDRTEAALGPRDPGEDKIEEARKRADAERARRKYYAARIAAGLPLRLRQSLKTRDPVSGSGN